MANILIVEDEKGINDLIASNLQLVGHSCTQVFDGSTALEVVLEQPFDLVLLDIMLPKLTGFEVMQRLKETPVIFLTALDSLGDRIKGFDLGADDYIIKSEQKWKKCLLSRIVIGMITTTT